MMTLQEEMEYEQAAQKTLELFTPMPNAELDLEALAKKYTCVEEDCGKIFTDLGNLLKNLS